MSASATGTQKTTRATVITVSLVALVLAVMSLESMPAIALPVIQRELHITPAKGALLVAFQPLMVMLATPLVGKLADLYGGRRVLPFTVGFVVLGATISATGFSYSVMIVGTILQGIGFGVLPLSFALLRTVLPPERMKDGVGAITGVSILGSGIGAVLAGPVSNGLSWHWIFGLPAIASALVGLASWLLVPSTPVHRGAGRSKLDWAGLVTFTLTQVILLISLASVPKMGWLSWRTGVAFALVLAFATGWALIERRVERRAREPFISLRMLRSNGMWGATVVSLVVGTGSSIGLFAIPQIIMLPKRSGIGLGGSLTQTGLYLLPMILSTLVASPVGALLDRWISSRGVIAVGLLITTASVASLIWLHSRPWQLMLMTGVTGIGYGFASTGMYNAAVAAVAAGETGIATGLNTTARSVGTAIGSLIAGAIITTNISPVTKLPGPAGFVTAFAVGAAVLLVGVAVTATLPSRRRLGSPAAASQAAASPTAVQVPVADQAEAPTLPSIAPA
jgi:MFS family permease